MPTNSHLLQYYISTFKPKLNALDVNSLSITGYPKTYLQTLLNNSLYYLKIYAHVLEKLLECSNKTTAEITIVDYGAGNGLLGMFAKHCGFKKVYLNDVSSVFIDASKKVSAALGIEIDGFIVGDCSELQKCFSDNDKPTAIVGTDVIEHIYSLEKFFSCIRSLNKEMVTVFTTASVTSNTFKSRQLMKLQHIDENVRSNAEHAMPGDEYAGLPFAETRKKIIEKSSENLSANTIKQLSRLTRGLKTSDIIKAVDHYVETKELPKSLAHPTNTCDPITGSWTERLLTEKEYLSIYKQNNFHLKFYNGFYNEWQSGIKGTALKVANMAIRLTSGTGKIISPFITLVAKGC